MKLNFLLLLTSFLLGCTQTIEVPSSKATHAQSTIQKNKTESQKAQQVYLELQKKRKGE